MKQEEVTKLCAAIRKRFVEDSKNVDPRELQLFDIGFALLETHLVNQARIADTLHSLLIHARNK